MGAFFVDKIRTIHAKLDKLTSALSEVSSDDTESWSGALMDHFKPLSEGDVRKLIEGFPKKSCTLDPMPSPTRLPSWSLVRLHQTGNAH